MSSNSMLGKGTPGTASVNDRQVGGSHYSLSAYQHWDYATDLYMRHVEGSATKYLARAGNKLGETREKDLEKALHYLEKAAELHKQSRLVPLYTHQPGGLNVASIVARFVAASMQGCAFTPNAVAALVLLSSWQDGEELANAIDLVRLEMDQARIKDI